MSPGLLSIRMKSFPAPFIFAKRSMMLIVAAAVLVVMSGLGRDISSCLLKLETPRLRWDDKKFVPEDQKKCEAIASSQFGVYLFRRETTRGLDFSCDPRTHAVCVVRGRLQQRHSRAD